MSNYPFWARHFQGPWQERAGDRRFPDWFRVSALAYGTHRANRHANFEPGQIGLILGRPDAHGIKPLDKGSVQRAIRKAIEYGFLAPASSSRCLVPAHAVEGGQGKEWETCRWHSPRVRR
jgi:hypothetical protein